MRAMNVCGGHFYEPEPEKEKNVREHVLDAAKERVCSDRNLKYGEPEDNFGFIAQVWSDWKRVHFSALDVAVMMALFKIARIKTGGNIPDNFVDLAGYAACAGEIAGAQDEV